MPTNQNIVELKIFDFETDHKGLTDLLGLEPTCIWVKGEEYIFGDQRNGIKKIREKNYWGYRSTVNTNQWIGDQIEEFIGQVIIPRKDILKELSSIYHIEFSIVQYMYDGCNPGPYFDKKAIKILNDCGLELNIDLYVLYQSENAD